MLFQARQKIVFIGDSITDCGRREAGTPYGTGYVNLVRSLIQARYPALDLTIVNKGIGGNTVRDLAARWQQDVIEEHPDWLSVKIGINDAYREVPLNEYETTLRKLLQQTREETGARFIMLTPYLIQPDRSNPERMRMDRYGAVMSELAQEFAAISVNTQSAFDTVLASTQATDWASDRVHPDTPGHAVIALAFLHAIGWELA